MVCELENGATSPIQGTYAFAVRDAQVFAEVAILEAVDAANIAILAHASIRARVSAPAAVGISTIDRALYIDGGAC